MFGRIAGRYDLANRLLSCGMDLSWRRRLVGAASRAKPGAILDLATGSGDVALALGRAISGAHVTGMDFCLPMLAQAEKKKAAAGDTAYPNVRFEPGDGLSLPLPDKTFDVVTIAFGLRNMADRHRSLTEMHRVLRPGGRLLVLEFSQPKPPFRALYLFYLRHILPILAGWITADRQAYVYLNKTIEDFPGPQKLSEEIVRAGFKTASAQRMTLGVVALHEAVS